MLVLGITDGITCGAAVVVDGRVVAAVNEERLSRLKMAFGFPRQSIKEVLRLAGAAETDVDLVAVATVNNYFHDGLSPFGGWFEHDKGFVRNAIFTAAGHFGGLVDSFPVAEDLYYRLRGPVFRDRRRKISKIVSGELGIAAPVEFIRHHLAHATSAYFTSGFAAAAVISMDGGGDGDSGHIYLVKDGRFQQISRTGAYHSLGNYYSYVTHISGFKAQKHEGKITGLAAHGEPRYLDTLESFIDVENGELVNKGRVVFSAALRKLAARLPENWSREDLAASIQQHSESLTTRFVEYHLEPERRQHLAIAGGLFANVRINQHLSELPGVEQVWVHPGMTDGGLAVGAALAPCMKERSGPTMQYEPQVLGDVYLGPEYTARQIEQALAEAGLAASRPASIEREVAGLLARGYVVARFDGRMEYGPRALGNRSILYHPADPSVNDWLNKHLERTEFMPFAPSTLIEDRDLFYHRSEKAKDAARFMTITFDCTDWMKQTCPGVVHLDGTARPHLVRAEENAGYHRIIEEFKALTGVGTIINTSFNMHEEPIVCSPADAIRAFRQGHLDYLAIGDYLVESPEGAQHEVRPMPQRA